MIFLKEIIDELERKTKYPYRLIVVDNGSIDGTREWIKKMYKDGKIWKYVFTKKNEFMTDAYAKAFKCVESEYFITTQDDILPPNGPCWLTQMVRLIRKYPEVTSISRSYCNVEFYKYIKRKYGGLGKKQ